MKSPDFIKKNLFDAGRKVRWRYDFARLLMEYLEPEAMAEIGVWKGQRSEMYLQALPHLRRFVGFDLFDSASHEFRVTQKTGECEVVSRLAVDGRLQAVRPPECIVELVEGSSLETLPVFCRDPRNAGRFDVVVIDGGHSLETVANDWKYALELIKEDGVVVLDDYHMHSFEIGCRQLIDGLVREGKMNIRWFPALDSLGQDGSLANGWQMTMVAVERQRKKLLW
jgi:hypothetical protein